MESLNKVLYRHRRLDTNEIFYVGIGNKRRPTAKQSRSEAWWNVYNISSIAVEVLRNDLTWDEAKELEILLINSYGRKDLGKGSLVNHTDGGEVGSFADKFGELNPNFGKVPHLARSVIKLSTKEIYSSVQKAADNNKINAVSLRSHLNRGSKSPTFADYRYASQINKPAITNPRAGINKIN